MKKLTLKQVANVVDKEGIGYAIQNYMSSDAIENEKLATLWEQASNILHQIDQMLEPYHEEM